MENQGKFIEHTKEEKEAFWENLEKSGIRDFQGISISLDDVFEMINNNKKEEDLTKEKQKIIAKQFRDLIVKENLVLTAEFAITM